MGEVQRRLLAGHPEFHQGPTFPQSFATVGPARGSQRRGAACCPCPAHPVCDCSHCIACPATLQRDRRPAPPSLAKLRSLGGLPRTRLLARTALRVHRVRPFRPPHPSPGSIETKELALDIKGSSRPFRFASGSRRRAPALLTPAKRLELALDIKGIRRDAVKGKKRPTTKDTKVHNGRHEGRRAATDADPLPLPFDMSKERS